MICPNCKKNNKSGYKKCFYCGFDLPENNENPIWLESFDGKTKGTEYISLDEFGHEQVGKDPRDILAEEMSHMRTRKQEGKIAQEHFRNVEKRRREANKGRVGLAPKPLNENLIAENAKQHSEFYEPTKDKYYNTPAEDYEYGTEEEQLRRFDAQNRKRVNIPIDDRKIHSKKKKKFKPFLFLLIILLISALAYGVYSVVQYRLATIAKQNLEKQVRVFPSLLDDLAAHTIMIPGDEGQQIYIKELHKSYLVTNGYATIEVTDFTWYENYEDYLNETMDVTISPFIKKTTGKQIPLDPINFSIDIPLSPLTIVSPNTGYDSAVTSIYKIEIKVRENSKLTINGDEYSDIVNTDNGNIIFNANIKPIGENKFDIVCKAQYCRSNRKTVTINRPAQEITVDLAPDISAVSTYREMTIKASTIPGVYVQVQSPHSDLDITNIDVDGSFKFMAIFDKIGDNIITFSASKPGLQTTVINYKVYYVPNIDIYSRKAWAMDDEHYNHLINTMATRVANSQIYVCIGVIEEFIAQEPQIAIMNCGTEAKPLRVLLENKTNKKWTAGQSFRVYADVFGLYKDMPRLIARYSYDAK